MDKHLGTAAGGDCLKGLLQGQERHPGSRENVPPGSLQTSRGLGQKEVRCGQKQVWRGVSGRGGGDFRAAGLFQRMAVNGLRPRGRTESSPKCIFLAVCADGPVGTKQFS